MRTARKKAGKPRVPPLPRPGKGAFMSVEELWRDHMPEKGRNQVYALATSGIFPFIRRGRCIDLLRKPTLAILRGDREPGGLDRPDPSGQKKSRAVAKKKPPTKLKSKKVEAATAALS
jgi:hypothetical protein